MGIAMFGVLWCHFSDISGVIPVGVPKSIIDTFAYSLFTQGFVFFSGMGLYYSFSKNCDIKSYYLRRLKRVFIPYVILTAPYFLYTDIGIEKDFLLLLRHLTGIEFFISGNYSGMWYISVILFLYLIFPLLYHLVFGNNGNNRLRPFFVTAALIIVWDIIRYVISGYALNYYNLPQMPNGLGIMQCFVMGMITMYIIAKHQRVAVIQIIGLLCICLVFKYLLGGGANNQFLIDYTCWMVLPYSLVYSAVLYFVDKCKPLCKVSYCIKYPLRFLGKYSLEIYVIHSIIYHFLRDYSSLTISPLAQISISILISLLICVPVNMFTNKYIYTQR